MEEEKQISKKERRRLKKEQEKKEYTMRYKTEKRKKVLRVIGWSIASLAVVIIAFTFLGAGKNLPPTSSLNHIEVSPPSHIATSPMDRRMHKHMLEHSDGGGPPGVIINYNCEDFECEPDLIDKLSQIVQDFPANVYLAPWSGMSAQLVVSAEGRQQILDGFDEQEIRDFINQ